MLWEAVLRRIRQGEDEQTELGRFRTFQEKDWLEAACAMANTTGGLIVLGVLDDGTLEGVPMPTGDVHERLTNLLQNGLSSPLYAKIGHHLTGDGSVFWVEVAKMRGAQPLRYRDRVFVRRHRSHAIPSEAELVELYNNLGFILTEERQIPGTSLSSIDLGAYRAYATRRGLDLDGEPLPPEIELERAEILARGLDDERQATLYGLLAFGLEPQGTAVTRGFFVQLAAYAGVDKGAECYATARALGKLVDQVKRTEEWLQGLGHTERYTGWQRSDRPIVAPRALREAVVNAIAHRDYALLGHPVAVDVFSNRVEITSPGALPNHKTPESVERGGPPRSRNEAIADHLVVMGYMERRGTGFPRMRRAMREFNDTLPLLEANRTEAWVRVTLSRDPPQ